jgi:hypothetical protein
MARETLERLKNEAKTLAPEEKEELRVTLDALIAEHRAPTAEDEVERRLYEAGLLREIKPRTADPTRHRAWKPVQAKGKPTSEVIIEDRG